MACIDRCKPGVEMRDVQRLSNFLIFRGLKALGFFIGEQTEEEELKLS